MVYAAVGMDTDLHIHSIFANNNYTSLENKHTYMHLHSNP